MMTYDVLKREMVLHPDVLPLLIVLTDGAGNVALGKGSPQKEAHKIADQIAGEDIRSVVINMEHEAFDQGLAQALAQHLDAPCYTLADLRSETLYKAVQSEIYLGPGKGAQAAGNQEK
jgi:magnesium chelatase subunit D